MIGINVNMPKNCQECHCLKYGEYGAFEKSSCAINHKIVISNKKRPIDCPLVELKGENKLTCDRNICLKNEYSNIGCEDCVVTKGEQK